MSLKSIIALAFDSNDSMYQLIKYQHANTKMKLERLQEKGLRADFKDKCSTYEDLLNKAKLPTLYNQRLQNIAYSHVYSDHGICPTYISDIFNLQSTQYSLRNSEFRYTTPQYCKKRKAFY